MKRIWNVTKHSLSGFSNDHAMTWAAAVAYYAGLSFAPLLLLGLTILGWVGMDARQQVEQSIEQNMGPQVAETATLIMDNASTSQSGGLAMAISIVVLLFSASGVFAQLQAALNRMWNVEARPTEGVMGWVRKRLLSMGMVLTILFLLLVSIAATTFVSSVAPGGAALWNLITLVVSIVVYFGLFLLLFKYLPDVRIGWRQVAVGAAVTAVLFGLGKYAIGLYLSYAAVGSSYGAAGSLIVLLVWVYYSAVIVFLGAEVTQAWAYEQGRRIEPDEHAVRLGDPTPA